MKNVVFQEIIPCCLDGAERPQYEHTAQQICSQGADGVSLLITTLITETKNTTQLGEAIYMNAEAISNLEKEDPLFEFDVCDRTEL